MTTPPSRPVPRATYRLQFNADFGFRDAAALAPYLATLGVSHVYASPYLMARPGSTHGYDIVDHNRLNPEIGSEADFDAMVAAFRAAGLGQILDFVPNHMGVGGADNPLWLDVLEWGASSTYSGWFDIDWSPDAVGLSGKVLIPVLGDQYGLVLQAGDLTLAFDEANGSFAVWAYGTHKLPVDPRHYDRILSDRHPVLERLGDAFGHIEAAHPHQRRHAGELKGRLADAARADPAVAAAIAAEVARFAGKPNDLASWGTLDELIRLQHWRVAHFRVAADDINYRRFFNVNELAGVRMELPELFDHAHALVFDLVERGIVDGIRIDHIDGLLDPKTYCHRLRSAAPKPFYLLVEKILAQHERLRGDWDTDGTTGYEFTNLATGLLIDPAGSGDLDALYAKFTRIETPFAEIVRTCKLKIMDNEMASELNVLAREAARIAASNPCSADFTRNLLQRALKEVVAAFPVYRTYVDQDVEDGRTDAADRRDLDWAFAHARRADASIDPSAFDFLYRLLSGDLVANPCSGYSHFDVVRFAMRVQQYSGPVMAKGLEDTAFYRYNRLLAANEVGGHPEHLGVSAAAFHEINARRARETPHALLSTSTHDTKRGEDTRARLAVLAELSAEWTALVPTWSRILRVREAGSGRAGPPDRNDEYVLYQLLLGAWPPGLAPSDAEGMAVFRDRIVGAMVKSMREAKLHTTWAAPDAEYEDAVIAFITAALDPVRSSAFLEAFLPFKDRVATLGAQNSLVQTALKLTVPGVPDVYRGAELWEFSLVDPDNRRPVDFALRQRMIGELPEHIDAAMLEDWESGRAKLLLTRVLLAHRAAEPALYRDGTYEPLAVTAGDGADAAEPVIAYARRLNGSQLVVAVRRFPSRELAAGTALTLAPGDAPRLRCLLSGRTVAADADGRIDLGPLLAELPVAALVPAWN
ncbi:malto-oligosyltrehalose synthase [Methylobrevis albus]|uniref:Malto-oligosyltrehalose synthase n=1 Tax=Methylobrevis albus TaxID=2793297 RepID=A0A931I199_9HYPH|nr:malto-oligosyltrehalose synthase [Methylobrevis albus]MBH0237524.1 malto-oligosyltrehalose synthase [Methylobrevis albus]